MKADAGKKRLWKKAKDGDSRGGRRVYSAAKIAKWGRENAVGRDDAESGGGPGQGREARGGEELEGIGNWL